MPDYDEIFHGLSNKDALIDLYEGIINFTEEKSGHKILGENRKALLDILLDGVDLKNVDEKITYFKECGVSPKMIVEKVIEHGGENVARVFSNKVAKPKD